VRTVAGLPLGDLFAAIGLIAVAVVSLSLLSGNLPFAGGSGGGGGGDGGAIRTPTPSNVVIVDPRTSVAGSILYVKAGNIWLQHGDKAAALTSSGADAMPSFSPDGTWIYFIRTTNEAGRWRIDGISRRFHLATPSLMRVRSDGSAQPETLLAGRTTSGPYTWSYFIRQPVVGPDGTIVVVTDGPNPGQGDVVLKRLDPATGVLTSLKAPESPPLGHQDPAFSPDGSTLLFVKNNRDGSRGASVLMRYSMKTGKAVPVTGPGYMSPAWSPDGRFIAATRTTTFGTDIVILDAVKGTELLRVTSDERSFDPVWSPAGDAIAYLSLNGGVADLWLAKLSRTADLALDGKPLQLTISAGLDAASRPGWWIPADQLPTPPPSPSGSAGAPGTAVP
jgi:dipeptidyl aminopeptidase/acylaminoacyl peptidase